MHTMDIGSQPRESSLVFMLMIDLKASNEIYFSKKHFVADQGKRYHANPILTFDKPLY